MLGKKLFTLNKFISSGLYALYWGTWRTSWKLGWTILYYFLELLENWQTAQWLEENKCHLNGITSGYKLAWKIVRVLFIDSLLICSNISSGIPQGAVLDVVLKHFINKWSNPAFNTMFSFGYHILRDVANLSLIWSAEYYFEVDGKVLQ